MKNKHTIIALTISLVLVALITLRLVGWWQNKPKQLSHAPHELDIVFGADTAPCTIYMYSSYSCPYCTSFFSEVLPLLDKEYISQGKVNLRVRLVDYSSNLATNNANKMAVCIARYGQFEKLHNLFSEFYGVIFTPQFEEMLNDFTQADDLVAQCYYGGEAENYLSWIIEEFEKQDFKGTPSFVIGNSTWPGALNFEQFQQIIDNQLNNFTNH